jgi:4-amino-4-deoxy-L-arabinose transferase-like glycosyltransferase
MALAHGEKDFANTMDELRRPSVRTLTLLLLIVLGGVAARLHGIDQPMIGFRPDDTAAIARNFYESGMHILYPQIDWRGNSPGYVESEFPIYTYGVALLYQVFGVHEVIGRLVSIGMYGMSALLLFAFARRLFDANVALMAVLYYSMATVVYTYTRSFQPEALLALSSLAAIYYFWIWTESGGIGALALSATGLCIAALIKPISLYLGLPLFYLVYRAFGWRFYRRIELWLFAFVVLIPPALWYRHSYHLWLDYGNTFGVFGGWVKYKVFPPDFRVLAAALGEILIRLLLLIATPLGMVLLVIGFFRRPPKQNYLIHWWCAGFAVAIVMVAPGMKVHDYYQLPAIFPAAACMGYGTAILWNSKIFSPRLLRPAVIAICVSVVIFSLWRWKIREQIPATEWNRIAFAKSVASLTEPSARIIMVRPDRKFPELLQHRTTEGEYLECDPVDFYRSHRTGWSVDDRQARVEFIETLRKRGAQYVATGFPEVFARHPELKAGLDARYTPVAVTTRWAIYRLEKPGESSARAAVQSVEGAQ